jgi:hypothetical protein
MDAQSIYLSYTRLPASTRVGKENKTMLNKITSIIFRFTVLVLATGVAVWLVAAGHIVLMSGLLMTMGATLAAIVFGFRVAEGFGNDSLSIRVGPPGPYRPAAVQFGSREELRKAA